MPLDPQKYILELRRIKHANVFFTDSAYDYISGRCLCLNNLGSVGVILQVQAIEKIMKAMIAEKNPSFNFKKVSHDLMKAFDIISQDKSYNISQFEGELDKLMQIYLMRYNDQRPGGITLGNRDNYILDEIYVELTDQIQIHPEIKFKSGLMSIVFDKYDQLRQYKRWALKENKPLDKRLPSWTVLHKAYGHK